MRAFTCTKRFKAGNGRPIGSLALSKRVSTRFGWILAGMLAYPAAVVAQMWSVVNPDTGVVLPTSAWANCTCAGGSCYVPPSPAPVPPIPGIMGSNYVYAGNAVCEIGKPPCWCRGIGSSLVRIAGVGTNTLSIRWDAVANANHDCTSNPHPFECPFGGTPPTCTCPSTYNTGGSAIIDIDLLLRINGVPPGTPVTVNYRWRQFSANMYRPEVPPPPGPFPIPPPPPYPPPFGWAPPPSPTTPDDESYVMGGSSLGGTGFGGGFNYLNQRGGRQGPYTTGQFGSSTDSTILFTHDARLDVRMRDPARGTSIPYCLEYDSESVAWGGELVLFLSGSGGGGDPEFPPEPCPAPTMHFSLDIGSDTELSDPTLDGNEVFDPGDAYTWLGPPLFPPGANGIRDDGFIFGFDPMPTPGVPGSSAPACIAIPDPTTLPPYFDLDGLDSLDFSLTSFTGAGTLTGTGSGGGPLSAPLLRFPSSCIQPAENLVISFDDDTALHYASGAGAGCSVPSTSLSPVTDTYGTAAGQDEVIGLTLLPLMPAAPVSPRTVGALYPIADEVGLHPSLAPDPPDGPAPPQVFDDDVDALDITGDGCDVWVFSVDHEASMGLDPGNIYEATPGGPVLVVDKVVHLGLPADVDIDDFEFVWTSDPSGSGGEVLTLLFSVNDDDPATPGLENGGILDPKMIYASYLTGSSFPYLDAPLDDDIDAITSSCDRLPPAEASAEPTSCSRTLLDADRRVFYNNSFYDAATTACSNLVGQPCNDNTAIATDKAALNSGGTATTANYISYSRSINGLMIDVTPGPGCSPLPAGPLAATNFEFRIANSLNLGAYVLAAAPISIDVTPGGGTGGSDRIKIIWANNAIPNTRWLRVLVRSNASGGSIDLSGDNIFYYGVAMGESLTPTATRAIVSSTDEIGARNNPHNSLNRVPVATNSTYAVANAPDARYDYDKSSIVSSTDEIISRNNPTNSLNALLLLNPAP